MAPGRLSRDKGDDARFSLTAEEEIELAERIAAMHRGEYIEYDSVDAFMRALRTQLCTRG